MFKLLPVPSISPPQALPEPQYGTQDILLLAPTCFSMIVFSLWAKEKSISLLYPIWSIVKVTSSPPVPT